MYQKTYTYTRKHIYTQKHKTHILTHTDIHTYREMYLKSLQRACLKHVPKIQCPLGVDRAAGVGDFNCVCVCVCVCL